MEQASPTLNMCHIILKNIIYIYMKVKKQSYIIYNIIVIIQ